MNVLTMMIVRMTSTRNVAMILVSLFKKKVIMNV